MHVHATSILPTAPGKHNDPVWKFTNALVKKLAKNRIKEESAKKAPKVRRAIIATFQTKPVDKAPTKLKQKRPRTKTHKQANYKQPTLHGLFPMKSNQLFGIHPKPLQPHPKPKRVPKNNKV